MVESDKKRQVIELRAVGTSYARIAQKVGISKQTVVDICSEQNEAIATLQAINLEELYETHRITKEERIKAHSSLLSKMRAELDKRTFEDVSTEKLIDLTLKVASALKEEIIEPKVQTSEEQERTRREQRLLDSLTEI